MKDYSEVIVGDLVTWGLKSGTFEVTKVLYNFAGKPMPTRPAIEAKMRNPRTLADHNVQKIGTRWDWSKASQPSAKDEQLAFKNRVLQ